MKYLLITAVTIIACIFISFFSAKVIGKKLRPGIRLLLTAAFAAGLLSAVFFGYVSIYYHATDDALGYLQSNDSVQVTKIDEGYLFDGVYDDTAIIFYPGGKVAPEAYAPVMYKLAEKGYDCFLLKMPFNLAILDPDKASDIMLKYGYEKWYLMGHSLGGNSAAMYAASSPDGIDGLILLAAYPSSKIDDGIRLLSVTGDMDGCLDMNCYSAALPFCPSDTEFFVIDGGNHSQFGSYGHQFGDKTAAVSRDDQHQILADKVDSWINAG